MRRFLHTAAIVFFLGSAFAVAAEKEIDVSVNGMVCGFCAQGITRKFSQEAAVDHVKVSLENKRVALRLKDGLDLSDDKITSILKNAGYSVSKIERK